MIGHRDQASVRSRLAVTCVAVMGMVLGLMGEAHTAPPPALVCKLPRESNQTLPSTAVHGLIDHLPQ